MKKTFLTFYLLTCALLVNAQTTMYVMKGGVVVGQHNVSTEVDSLIFYAPTPPGPIAISSISFSNNQISMVSGETLNLLQSLTITPSNATNKTISWSSNNSSIASVNNATGVVSAGNTAGSATITATTTDGSNLSANITITVSLDAPNKYYVGTIPNAVYIGRWQKEGLYDRSGYNGAMMKVNFTGRKAIIEYNAGNMIQFFAKIDDGPWVYHNKTFGTGEIDLTPTPLASNGEHSLTIVAGEPNTFSPDRKAVIKSLKLETANEVTKKPTIGPKHIEFIGDSISTICYEDDTPDQHWNWIVGENLGWTHSHIALPSNTTNDLMTKYPTFFNGSGTWNFSTYDVDAIVVNLGQNGGVPVDSPTNVYRKAVASFRSKWPNAPIICLGLFWSASATSARNIEQVVNNMIAEGDNNLYFLKDAEGLAGLHPANQENDNIAAALTPKIKTILGIP